MMIVVIDDICIIYNMNSHLLSEIEGIIIIIIIWINWGHKLKKGQGYMAEIWTSIMLINMKSFFTLHI